MVTVHIPALMRSLTGGRERVEVAAGTLGQIVEGLDRACPGIKERLLEDGAIVPHISVVVNGEVTPLALFEEVPEGSDLYFMPAISGGGRTPYFPEREGASKSPCGSSRRRWSLRRKRAASAPSIT